MRRSRLPHALAALLLGSGLLGHTGLHAAPPPSPPPVLAPGSLAPVRTIVETEIASGHIPGAVVLIGQGHDVVYREAFGLRATTDGAVPMTAETLFDLASLTKVVATTTAVMQLVDKGLLALDAPAARYWPAFGSAGKTSITIRHLLTHYSGMKPDLNLARPWSGYRTAMAMLIAERPRYRPGERYIYSDENFEVLGEIVRRVSGLPLDRFCERHIFEPLGMRATRFTPVAADLERTAPTGGVRLDARGRILVNDPTARRMGGIAGHAGLFSTADDLARFATMLLDGGMVGGVRVLQPATIAAMTERASPASGDHARGLGWDLAEPLIGSGGDEPRRWSFGHTGYTGTMIWIDPASRTYAIVLTNRTYPDGRGDAQPLRKGILAQVTSVLDPRATDALQTR